MMNEVLIYIAVSLLNLLLLCFLVKAFPKQFDFNDVSFLVFNIIGFIPLLNLVLFAFLSIITVISIWCYLINKIYWKLK